MGFNSVFKGLKEHIAGHREKVTDCIAKNFE